MSQTLSLEPGKYALFITPPVAGVDFTGTPLPSVSYQWRKNGVAIAGQTNATIGGVGVEQAGSVVSLVDGDVISIDIILTNPVSVATKTISATINSAIPAPVISPVSVRQLSGGTYQTVTSLANTDIGEQVIVASNTGGTVTTTPPVLTTYQWRRGYGAIAGATAQNYTLQAADADSIIDCVVTAANAGGTTTATAAVIVGTVADVGGWTQLTPSADSRLIYVSNDGDDVAAAGVKGRGYYLPSDDEIGPDPTNPSGTIVAYRTLSAANARARNGAPDWIMFRRGEQFEVGPVLMPTGNTGGRSDSERRVYASWGPLEQPRARLDDTYIRMWGEGGGNNAAFLSLEFENTAFEFMFDASNITIEDCSFGRLNTGVHNRVQAGTCNNIKIRRTAIFENNKTSEGHVQALYVSIGAGDVLLEECVFDRNGYLENPDDATTWTAEVASAQVAGVLPAGTGVQPSRTYFDRNLYLNVYGSMTVRGCISSRAAGGGSVQMREGGVSERNLFIWNQSALGMSHPQSNPARHKGSLIKDNVVLHDDHLLPDGGWGIGLTAGGADDDVAVLDGNIVAHFHRGNNGDQSLGLVGKSYYSATQPASKLMRGIVKDNAVYREFGGVGIMVNATTHDHGVLDADVTGNAVATLSLWSMQGNSSKPAEFVYTGNRFHSATGSGLFRWGWESNINGSWETSPYTEGTFAQWQSAGFDTDGTFTNDFAAFKSAVGWTAPERDIVSYMQSVDPTYVVNEDVYIDEEASVKQAVRQKVWEVLSNRNKYPANPYWDNKVLDEARAKQAARRYHAFITFIQRAKSNRRGAWDTRWTAEAVNNYIRAGYGKAPITGAYDNRSLATRLAEYTS